MDFKNTTQKDITAMGVEFVKLGYACGDFAEMEAKRDRGEITEDEFQEFFSNARTHGIDSSVYPCAIGGSDTGKIMGVSKWGTPSSVAREKTGLAKAKISAEKQKIFFRGHVFETPVRMSFEKKTGKRVLTCSIQFKHPDYPHCIADIDGIVVDDDGTLQLYEGKTTLYFGAREKFINGECPEDYYCQIQYYMGVLNTIFSKIPGGENCFTRCYINCAWGFDADNDMTHLVINYDKDFATSIFEECESLIDNIIEGTVPSYENVKHRELVFRDAEADFGKIDITKDMVELPDEHLPTLEKIEEAQKRKKEISAEKKEWRTAHEDVYTVEKALKDENDSLTKDIKDLCSCLVEDIKDAPGGVMHANGKTYTVSFKQKNTIDKDTMDYFKKEYPDVYEDIMMHRIDTRSIKVEIKEDKE